MLPLSASPRLRAVLISLAIVSSLGLFAITSAVPVLRVSLAPEESPSVLRRKFKPLSDYLEERIGMKVEFRPMASRDALIDALAADKLDLVWFGGFDLVRARLRSGDQVDPIVQREEDALNQSVFITAQGDVTTLEDLKGKTFAFGPKSSLPGYLMPRMFLRSAYVDPEIDMGTIHFLDTDEAVIMAVAGGRAVAGVLSLATWRKILGDARIDPGSVHVFYTSPAYCDYNWAARANMDSKLRQKLIDAFLALDASAGRDAEILALQRAARFVVTKVENYSVIEAASRSAGLLK